MASQPTIGNLNSLFDPVYNQAEESALTPTLLGSKGDQFLRLMMAQPPSVPAAPQLNFNTNATGIGTGITQGLGNAVNNAMQMRGYNQQMRRQQKYEENQQALQDLSMQRDLAAQQQAKQDMADQEAYINAQPEAARGHLRALSGDRPGFRQLVGALATPALAPGIAQAKGLETTATEQAKNKASQEDMIQRLGMLQKAGVDINTPAGQNLFHALAGFQPTSGLDIQGQTLENAGKGLGNQGTALENTHKQLMNQYQNLNNMQEVVKTRFADAMATQELRDKMVSGDLKANELERIQNMPRLLDEAMTKLNSGEQITPNEMFQLQGTMNLLADKDPKFGELFKDYGFIKKDKQGNYKVDKGGLKSFMEGAPNPATLQIKPLATHGNIMQAPSGKWFDVTTHQEVPAPKQAQPQGRPHAVPVQPTLSAQPGTGTAPTRPDLLAQVNAKPATLSAQPEQIPVIQQLGSATENMRRGIMDLNPFHPWWMQPNAAQR